MQRRIIVSVEGRRLISEAVNEGNKIKAIKAARAHGRLVPPDPAVANPDRPGLKHAKNAVDHKYWPESLQGATPSAVLDGCFRVKTVIVQIAGEGDVELDLEGLQMRFLQDLESLGLTEVQHLLELTEFIKKWQD